MSHGHFDTAGKTALITGGKRGIGKSIVDALIATGVRKVYAPVRNPDSAANVVKQHGDKIKVLQLDLQDPAPITAAAKQASDVHLVVNNGGVLRDDGPMNESALENLDFEMDVNVKGLIRVAQAFGPALKENGTSGGGSAFVQLNSLASLKISRASPRTP